MPFPRGVFDAVCYHFALLWIRGPVRALREAYRVLAPGGAVLILSEPDLASRRDEPDTGLGRAIAQSVERMGGHPAAGREVARWLEEAGFRPLLKTTRLEWRALSEPAEAEHELAFLVERGILGRERASAMAKEEREASRLGVRRVLLPLTYGLGLKRQ
jgi:ubiquinone/menaquinone biosynthesis C-methylase UbiE